MAETKEIGSSEAQKQPQLPDKQKSTETRLDTSAAHTYTLESRKDAIRPIIEGNDKKNGALDAVFLDVKSDLLVRWKELMSELLEEQLSKEPFSKVVLSETQKSNLKVGILAKLSAGGIMAHMFNGISTKIGSAVSLLQNKKWEEALRVFGGKEKKGDTSGEKWDNAGLGELIRQARNLTESALQPFATLLHDGNEAIYKQLLENPQMIAEYKGDKQIPVVTTDQLSFLAKVNLNILQIDGSLRTIEQTTEKGLNLLAGAPEFVENGFFTLLSGLLKLPFIKNILTLLLGYANPEEVIAGTTEKLTRKRAVLSLRTFGIVKDEKWTEKRGENIGKIKGLENIDMTSISDKKLEPFFDFCKKNDVGITQEKGANRQSPEFWSGIFTGNPKIEMNMKKGEVMERVGCPMIDLEKTNSRVTDAEWLIKSLNALTGIPTEKTEEKKEKREQDAKPAENLNNKRSEAIANALAKANGEQTKVSIEYAQGVEAKPKNIEFVKNGKKWDALLIDGQKYTLTVDAGDKNEFKPYLEKYNFLLGNLQLHFTLENWAKFTIKHPGMVGSGGDPVICTSVDLAEKITELVDTGSVTITWKSGKAILKRA